MTEAPQTEQHESTSFEGYFRDADFAPAQPLAWALSQRQELLEALRGLFNGPQAMVQLRLWCFMELATQPQARLTRDDFNRLFHALLPEALDAVLKRLRDLNLLTWDATAQDYTLSPLAQQVHGLLAPLTTPPAAEYDDMAALLAQVAGAQQLGLVTTNQLKHLHAQLARLHDEFAEAIASRPSGSTARDGSWMRVVVASAGRGTDPMRDVATSAASQVPSSPTRASSVCLSDWTRLCTKLARRLRPLTVALSSGRPRSTNCQTSRPSIL